LKDHATAYQPSMGDTAHLKDDIPDGGMERFAGIASE
jgi:hypothetical protein